MSSPKGGKGKKKARQPSPEPAESSDEGTIDDLIAAVGEFRADVVADLAMERTAASKRYQLVEAHIKSEAAWRREQRGRWDKEKEWREGLLSVLGRIADSLETRDQDAETAEGNGEAEGSGAMEEEGEKEKEKESTGEEDAEGENDMEITE